MRPTTIHYWICCSLLWRLLVCTECFLEDSVEEGVAALPAVVGLDSDILAASETILVVAYKAPSC
jgi:hypothetical protein